MGGHRDPRRDAERPAQPDAANPPKGGIEFVDDAGYRGGAHPYAGDVLEVRSAGPDWLRPRLRTRRSSRLRSSVWIAAAVLALGIAVVLHRPTGPDDGSAAPKPQAAAHSTSAQPYDAALSPDFVAVLGLAHHRGPLTDYIRQDSPAGSCAPVRVGYSPVGAIVRTAATYVPHLALVDSSRTLDQFTGLCAVELRAAHGHTSVLTISDSTSSTGARHPAFASVETGISTTDGITTKYASVVTPTGRRIVIGDTGPSAAAVSIQDLLALAQTRALDW